MTSKPITDYGLLSDCRTAALVSTAVTMSTFFGPSMTVIPGPTEETLVALTPHGVPLRNDITTTS